MNKQTAPSPAVKAWQQAWSNVLDQLAEQSSMSADDRLWVIQARDGRIFAPYGPHGNQTLGLLDSHPDMFRHPELGRTGGPSESDGLLYNYDEARKVLDEFASTLAPSQTPFRVLHLLDYARIMRDDDLAPGVQMQSVEPMAEDFDEDFNDFEEVLTPPRPRG